jgi:hypothetical protein
VALSFILNPHEPSKLTLIVERFYFCKFLLSIPDFSLPVFKLSHRLQTLSSTTSLMLVFIIVPTSRGFNQLLILFIRSYEKRFFDCRNNTYYPFLSQKFPEFTFIPLCSTLFGFCRTNFLFIS